MMEMTNATRLDLVRDTGDSNSAPETEKSKQWLNHHGEEANGPLWHVSPIVATSPKLMVVIFPWDRESEDRRMKKQGGDSVQSDGELCCRSGAKDGASAKGTGAAHNAPEATIGGGDLRTHRFSRVLPIDAKPSPLLVAAFPWNRERGNRTEKKPDEVVVMSAKRAIGGAIGGGTRDGQRAPWRVAVMEGTRKKMKGAADTGKEMAQMRFGANGTFHFGSRFCLPLGLNQEEHAQNKKENDGSLSSGPTLGIVTFFGQFQFFVASYFNMFLVDRLKFY